MLYEDESFNSRELAALIASKVPYDELHYIATVSYKIVLHMSLYSSGLLPPWVL